MPATPLCSVVLPTYNRMHTLPRAVASVLAQDFGDFELIVVDDASTDGTQDWLATQSDRRIHSIRVPNNGGPSIARNLGIAAARAQVIAFLDSDDIYRPNRLSRPLSVFATEADVVCTLSSSVKHNKLNTETLVMPDVTLAPTAFEWALICDLVAVETSSLTVRSSAARTAGQFCEALKHTEDREFLIRLARQGAGRLISDVLWEKYWSDTGLSQDWAGAGRALVSYVTQRPEYLRRYRKIGSYFASEILIADLRRRDIATFADDVRQFLATGLISHNVFEVMRTHREVRAYRRTYNNSEALKALGGAQRDWN
jgi:glycosyltransferase involved in cell wall biosynthesis